MTDADEFRARLDALETAVFRKMPKPDSDGWITNGYSEDAETRKFLEEDFGMVIVGDPKPTIQRTVDELKSDGIVGLYAVKQ